MGGWQLIEDFILKYDYCCGCGVCAGVCPANALEMRFNQYDEYKPYLTGSCADCGLCSKVCPFINGNPNEDDIGKTKFADIPGIKHTRETGYYFESYVGYAADPDMRWNGASGGLTTWLLCTLLKKKMVDYAITVSPTGNPDRLFEYRVMNNQEEIRRCSKSAYYPVELSKPLRYIKENPGRYAIVGLPCFIKAIELASMHLKNIRQRIVFKVGLTCGHMNSKFLAEYLLRLKRVDPSSVRRVSFREKEKKKPAMAHLFKAFSKSHDELCRIYWNEGYSKAFMHEYFMLNSCAFCDDVFAECADVTFMDAWIDPYKHLSEGTNILIARTKITANVLDQSNRSRVDPIDISQVILSQRSGLVKKRTGLAMRIIKGMKKDFWLPDKRVETSSMGIKFGKQGLYIHIKDRWREAAKTAMLAQKSSKIEGLAMFDDMIRTQASYTLCLYRFLSIADRLKVKSKNIL